MAKLRVHCFTISVDGYGAGSEQTEAAPMGIGASGGRLHQWYFSTPFGAAMIGAEPPAGDGGIDQEFLEAGVENIGAHVMGRNMFGPVRGPWPDESWRGWWGETPPYGHDVFVLTHHERADLAMDGGTTFHFWTAGLESAVEAAFIAAGGQDVRLGGGVSVVQQAMKAKLVDSLHLTISPMLLGGGERLFDNLDDAWQGYSVASIVGGSSGVAHVTLVKT